jgi:quercetin dioxygenase-like cupin family protein
MDGTMDAIRILGAQFDLDRIYRDDDTPPTIPAMTTLHNTPTVRPSIVASGEGERIWFTNAEITIKASAETTDGHLCLIETNAPVGHGPPLHIHRDEHEAFYLIAGTLELQCGEQRYRAEAGAFVFLPAGIPHTFRVSEGPARMLTIAVPGGLEAFFREAGRRAEGPGMPPSAPVDVELLKSVGERHGSQIVGPPLR